MGIPAKLIFFFIVQSKFLFNKEMRSVKLTDIGTVGVQVFGSFQKIMMLPPPSFELATN